MDFGVLSARSVVTGSDGKATLVYTAPPSPAVSPDAFLVVDIVVTPLGTDYNNSNQRSAAIRLVPQGPVSPPFNLVADFDVHAGGADRQPDACSSTPREATGSIAAYSWNFGDGARGDGRTDDHAYATPGTYVVTLTVDGRLRPDRVEVAVDYRDAGPAADRLVRLLADGSSESGRPSTSTPRSRVRRRAARSSATRGTSAMVAAGHRRPDDQQDLCEPPAPTR